MPDVLDSMMAKVGGRAQRPPKVPVTPSLHPRTWGGQSEGAGALEQAPLSASADKRTSRKADRPLSTSAHERIGAKAQTPISPGRPVRVARLPVTAEQDLWLRMVCASALADGTRLSEATVLRLALDRLRAGGAGWPELRDAVVGETRARTQRRATPGVSRREEAEAG